MSRAIGLVGERRADPALDATQTIWAEGVYKLIMTFPDGQFLLLKILLEIASSTFSPRRLPVEAAEVYAQPIENASTARR